MQPVEPVLIRGALEADVAAIQGLERRWSAEGITHGFLPDGEHEIGRWLGPYLLVAEAAGEIIGFISGSLRVSEGLAVAPTGTSYLEIDNLYVAPEFRQKGIGGRLVEQLLAAAKREGVRKVLVYSASKDIHRVLAFYESHGFHSWFVQMFQDL